jgi:hypothetical protein
MRSGSIQISVPAPEIHFQTSTVPILMRHSMPFCPASPQWPKMLLVVVPMNGTLSHSGPSVMLMVW